MFFETNQMIIYICTPEILNTYTISIQYFYLPTQIRMDIVYRITSFKDNIEFFFTCRHFHCCIFFSCLIIYKQIIIQYTHCTSEILNTTLNTCFFSTTNCLFRIIYLSTQIPMVIVYRKTGFKRIFKIFNVHYNKNNYQFCFKKDKNIYSKANHSPPHANFQP